MKRILILLLSLVMLTLPLVSCGEENSNLTLDIEAEANAIIEKYSLSGGTRYTSTSTTLGEYLDDDLIRSYFGDAAAVPDFGAVESYVVYIDESKPVLPCEFGIFKMKNGANTKTFMSFLEARIAMKLENAKSYPSMDTSMLKTAEFVEKDGYIWYCAVKDANEEINSSLKSKLN